MLVLSKEIFQAIFRPFLGIFQAKIGLKLENNLKNGLYAPKYLCFDTNMLVFEQKKNSSLVNMQKNENIKKHK